LKKYLKKAHEKKLLLKNIKKKKHKTNGHHWYKNI